MTLPACRAFWKSWFDRLFWVRIHRYAGLVTALFLAVAGLTGNVLAFTFEIDS
ncbi:PepSY domain-containing protein [Candidatus Nitrotoga arctica]|uniref:PepSY domain-containing protein n=1 Tax=Candidatus Nitrotoga arctica TaxID=453162 RepID=UPI001EFC0FB7|nr:PepSY domain-containing protein [Candidatus Nitrotoga arctica]